MSRIPRHVLTHLRAVAEGIPAGDAARRYLVNGDEVSAMTAHRAAVALSALVARRAGLGPGWRLLRITLPLALPSAEQMPLEEWAVENGYEDFSTSEQLAAYEAALGVPDRKAKQIERLRRARMGLLDDLGAYTAEPPALTDSVELWFPEELAQHLQAAGFYQLGELRSAISIGGQWWRGLPSFGPVKADRLASEVMALVGTPQVPKWAPDAGNFVSGMGDLLEQWIRARTASKQTGRAYRREVQRFLIWLALERRKALQDFDASDCAGYMDFLRAVPVEWMSRRNAKRFGAGWAPFSTQPSVKSQQYALTVVNAFCSWTHSAGNLERNAWELVNTRLPDDPDAQVKRSRAITPVVWRALEAHLPTLRGLAAARMRWILAFGRGTGLRAAELLGSARKDFFFRDGGTWIKVHGKGARNRDVFVPSSALNATREYFGSRGLDFDTADPATPVLGAVAERKGAAPGEDVRPLSYSTLAAAFQRFVRSALKASELSTQERDDAWRASIHWLRHTHATHAVEAGVDIDVQQANLGHADPRTTATYYRAPDKRRMEQLEQSFGDLDSAK